MGKAQKKGSGGAFLRCDIILTRQRQDTIKRHRARSSAEMRQRPSRDDGRGKIAAQPPPRKPSPRAGKAQKKGSRGAFLRCDTFFLFVLSKRKNRRRKRKPLGFRYGERRTAVCALLRIDALLTLQFSSLRVCSYLCRASRLSFRLPLTNGMGWDFYFC